MLASVVPELLLLEKDDKLNTVIIRPRRHQAPFILLI